jgi:putative ABC transport system permease protein
VIKHLLKLVWNRKRANALIVAEIFISFLVIFAVLTGAITLLTNWNRPIGFQWDNVWDVSMEYDIDGGEKADPELHATVMRMLDETRAFPQVAAAALSNTPPYAFSTSNGSRDWKGKELNLLYDDVTDDFAKVMRMKVLRGRWFDASDDASPHQPIVIDANTAEEMFGSDDPVGEKFEDLPGRFWQIVGVVEAYRKDGEPSRPRNMVFLRTSPTGNQARLGSHLLVRVHPGTPAQFEEQLATRLQQVAPKITFRVRHMDQMRMNMLRTHLAPVAAGGIVGMFLITMVALGLTGVLWQNVTRRTREIGLRRAMGASGPTVNRQILLEVVLLATIAMLIGTIIILQLPVLGAFSLVSKSAFTLGFAGALATIYALTVLCGLYPSWLASRLTPAEALRYE